MFQTYSKIIAYSYSHLQEVNSYVKLTHEEYKLEESG